MRTLQIGKVYRHFKNKYYLAVGEALHSETDEKYVIYKQLYGEGLVYIRPYDMFLSEVDREKYPDVKQKYRFECINGPDDEPDRPDQKEASPEAGDEASPEAGNERAPKAGNDSSVKHDDQSRDPEDETFDRYYEQGGWREYREDAEAYDSDPEDETFDRYYEQGGWREFREDAEEYGLDPSDFATEEEMEEAIQQLIAGAFQGY